MNFLRTWPKDKLQKVILVGIGALIALAAVGNFYIGAQLASRSKSRQEIVTLKHQIDDAEREARQETQDRKLRDDVASFVQDQTAKMVYGDPFSWVVRQITLFAESHPVRVLSMRPGGKTQSVQKSRFNVYTTHIEVEGSYDELGKFVRDLENSFPTTQVRSLELSAGGASPTDHRAILQLAFLVQSDSDSEKSEVKSKVEKKKE